jgi:uncharacterized protein (UPF0332 family)
MSDAARLARQAYSMKPAHVPYSKFTIPVPSLQAITAQIPLAVEDSAHAAVISFAEAMGALQSGLSSWAIVRLYYSTFYSIRSMILIGDIVPFHSGREMLLDTSTGKFLGGGSSSHHWNWTSIRQTSLKQDWFTSQDSQEAYKMLRDYRENVNYTHAFTEPNIHPCLTSNTSDLSRRLREYRDDSSFTYTYLPDHLAIAYPIRLIFELDAKLRACGLGLGAERVKHLQSLWKFKDRCPLT